MTKLQIFNVALGHIGSHRVSSVDEASNEAEHCRTAFDKTRRSLLRAHDWNFATTEVTLSAVADAEMFDFDNAYQLPSDYIKAVKFGGYEAGTKHNMWKIAGDKVHSNISAENAELEYIYDETDCTKWDDLFVDAFSYYLAAAIVPALSSSPALAGNFLSAGQAFLNSAKGTDLQESRLEIIRGSEHSAYQRAREGRYPSGNWMLLDAGPPN